MRTVELLHGAWRGDRPIALAFPDGWNVRLHGAGGPPLLTGAEIGARLSSPIGSPSLERIASGRSQAVIIVDDPTRPTPAAALLVPILDKLEAAGIGAGSIRIVIAGGTHAPATPEEAARKVGDEAARRVIVVSHDPGKETVFLGESGRGAPIRLNRHAAEADLRIGVS
ncbi:MAG: lactate racemase domain-containing protein, partial [Candidatus Eisenbacteria bacterium]